MDGYRKIAPITRWLGWLLIAGMAVAGWSLLLAIGLLAVPSVGLATLRDTSAIAEFGLLLVTYAVFGRWLYIASRNLHVAGVPQLHFTPAACIWWYAVPFAGLVMPYRAMREIWNASHNPAGGYPSDQVNDDGHFLLTSWWGLWIASNILGQVALRMSGISLQAIAMLDLLIAIVDIPLYWQARTIVTRVARAQASPSHGLREVFA